MREDDVERVIWKREGVDIADLEAHIRCPGGDGGMRLFDDGGRGVDADDGAGGEVGREPDGDGARPAANVKEGHVWFEMGEKEGS